MSVLKWSHDELVLAFNLYCKVPFTKINTRNREIIELSRILGRSVSAVALKLANFARLDPALQLRNIAGMRHGAKAEIEIWRDFQNHWEELGYESEELLAKFKGVPLERSTRINLDNIPRQGKERERVVRVRVNQKFFRDAVLASYEHKCCITGLNVPDLLIASHIIPWAKSKKHRMNPSNGLCLNALHDKAFDRGFITITNDFEVKISPALESAEPAEIVERFFLPYAGKQIRLPQRFLPDVSFLKYHNNHIFISA